MRLVELAVALGFVAGIAAFGRALMIRTRGAPRSGVWTVEHRYEDGARRVYVERGAEREPVGSIPVDAPDYEDAFLQLTDRARERAAVLNSER